MKNPLVTYLHDHLAGADLAIKLLQHLSQHHQHEELQSFWPELLVEVEKDRRVLQELAESVGSGTGLPKETSLLFWN